MKAGKTIYNFREEKIGPETYTLSGHSVFYKNARGEIFRTYGTFGRGSEQFMVSTAFSTCCRRAARNTPEVLWIGQRFTASLKAAARTLRPVDASRVSPWMCHPPKRFWTIYSLASEIIRLLSALGAKFFEILKGRFGVVIGHFAKIAKRAVTLATCPRLVNSEISTEFVRNAQSVCV